MEGLMQRHLDPKGLQEMVHVSCLEEGQELVALQNAGPRATLSVGNRHPLRIDLVLIFFRQSFKLAEKLQEGYKEVLYAFHPDPQFLIFCDISISQNVLKS